jgi:hypothetical protein
VGRLYFSEQLQLRRDRAELDEFRALGLNCLEHAPERRVSFASMAARLEARRQEIGPHLAEAAPRTKKPRQSGASVKCAEEDSNLHPVIPDQALNLVTGMSDPSEPRQSVHLARVARTIWTHRTPWMLPRMLPAAIESVLRDAAADAARQWEGAIIRDPRPHGAGAKPWRP